MTHSPQHGTDATSHDDSQNDSQDLDGTALVLGGGGSAGNAWLIGMVAGLVDGGIDVTSADLVVGTSAGATAAAQVTSGRPPAALLADVLDAAPPVRPAPVGSDGPTARPRPSADHMERLRGIIAASSDAADLRHRMAAAALELEAASDGSWPARWRGIVAARLPDASWPERQVLITAVDARTGAPVVFDRDSGVDLVDAVAASCSSGIAYAIGDGRYIDGGYRTNAENADLAAGCSRVLVLSPFGSRSLVPAEWGTHLATQVEALRAGGSRVEVVGPDAASSRAFGDDMMDPSTRPPAAQAGFEQGRALAEQLAGFWA